MSFFQWAWAVLFAIGGLTEIAALIAKKRQDTLSEQVWILRTSVLIRIVLFPFWMWLTYHFWFEPTAWGPVKSNIWWDDIVVLAVSAFGALFLEHKDTRSKL